MDTILLGLFAHTDDGAKALKKVLEAGVSPGEIVVVGDLGVPAGEAGAMHHVTFDALGIPREQRERFMEGIRGGGVVLGVRGDVSGVDQMMREFGASLVERVVGGRGISHNVA